MGPLQTLVQGVFAVSASLIKKPGRRALRFRAVSGSQLRQPRSLNLPCEPTKLRIGCPVWTGRNYAPTGLIAFLVRKERHRHPEITQTRHIGDLALLGGAIETRLRDFQQSLDERR